MSHKLSSYQSRPRALAPTNPIVLSQRATAWLFWALVVTLTTLIIGSTYWLLQ